jgi:hypothetical protein
MRQVLREDWTLAVEFDLHPHSAQGHNIVRRLRRNDRRLAGRYQMIAGRIKEDKPHSAFHNAEKTPGPFLGAMVVAQGVRQALLVE